MAAGLWGAAKEEGEILQFGAVGEVAALVAGLDAVLDDGVRCEPRPGARGDQPPAPDDVLAKVTAGPAGRVPVLIEAAYGFDDLPPHDQVTGLPEP